MLLTRPSHNGHGRITKKKLYYDGCPACNMNASFWEWFTKGYATSEETRYMQHLAERVYLHGPWKDDGTLNMNVVRKEG